MAFRALAASGVLLATAGTVFAVDIAQYANQPARHDRWVVNASGTRLPTSSPDFIMQGSDLSGIGWFGQVASNPNTIGRALTLVTRRHVLYPVHWSLAPNHRVQFINSEGTVFSYTVQSVNPLTRSSGAPADLGIATLNVEVDQSITPLRIGSRTGLDYRSMTLHVYGKTGRVGTNRLSSFWDPSWDLGTWQFTSTATAPAGTAVSESGDSGSPTFVVVDGEPIVVGVRWLSTVDSWVPAFADQLNAVARLTGQEIRVYGTSDPFVDPPAPARCTADADGNGVIDINDVLSYVTAFSLADLSVADTSPAFGVLDINDINTFVFDFSSQCQ